MTDRKNSELIKTSLNGLVRLEFYKDRGFVVTIQVDKKKFFYIEIDTLNELISEYNEIIRIKGKK